MNHKEKSASLVSKMKDVFRCPICTKPIKVTDLKSMICTNRHTFDFAKQGYVNMMVRHVQSDYNKKLFEARHKIMGESRLFAPLHDQISKVIKNHFKEHNLIVLDAGSGEGSHLQKIVAACENEAITGIGLDISKEGIRMAARNYQENIWLVGDLANSPLADHSCHVVLNILSPANYIDFKRTLVPNGLIIKVVPHTNYLKELREVLYGDQEEAMYQNDKTVALFKQHFHLVEKINLHYTEEVSKKELTNLVEMSPLSWNAKSENIDRFIQQDSSKITVALDMLIGINKSIAVKV